MYFENVGGLHQQLLFACLTANEPPRKVDVTAAVSEFAQKVTAWDKCNLETMHIDIVFAKRCGP